MKIKSLILVFCVLFSVFAVLTVPCFAADDEQIWEDSQPRQGRRIGGGDGDARKGSERSDRQKPMGRGDMNDRKPGTRGMDGMGGGGRHGNDEDGRMQEKFAEFQKWLEKEYPEQAEKLADLKKQKPDMYRRQMMIVLKKYGRIYEASKSNPELAATLKEDLELNAKRDALLRKIAKADEQEKVELAVELKEVLSRRYDLILKRKEIAYRQLQEKLEKLQKEAAKKQVELDKWKDAEVKNKNLDSRMKELVEKTETFKWE
ncbi:MAG: hypothetical protein H8D47_05560 [Planctomycetes bacterium]|nr:hypothetical protein [Planctomycetota bacterium]